jgi:hypothetical protein
MKPLIALVAKNHLVYACAEGCYNATSDRSDCVCGGANRGLGRAKAQRNTLQHWKEWADAWQARHPNVEIVLIDLHGLTPDYQLKLFK